MGLAQFVHQLWLKDVGGTGVRIRRYPNLAVGVTLTGSGVAYTYKAASANVKAFVAANTIKANWRYYGIEPFTPSAAASEYFILLGAGTGAGASLTQATALLEIALGAITVATGQVAPVTFPYAPTVPFDGVNDAALGDLTTTNGAADTLTCGAFIATGVGS